MSPVVNAAAVRARVHPCCSVATSILQNRLSPGDTQSSSPSLSRWHLQPYFLCLWSSGTLYEWTQTFVLPCLAYVTEHNAFRLHPCCSLSQNCLPFRLGNIYCVDGLWSACLFFCRGTQGISTFISHVLSYLWNSFRKSHDPRVIHHYLLCKLFYFEIHQSSEAGESVREFHLCLRTDALGYSFYCPCVGYARACDCLLTRAARVHGVCRCAVHLCVGGGGAGSGSWAGGLGPEAGRRVQAGAPRGSLLWWRLCPASSRIPARMQRGKCVRQPRHEVT